MIDFARQCQALGLPVPVPEYRFHPTRKWRLDYAWPDRRLALEVEGGIWMRGRHTRGSGFRKDMEKYNTLAIAGWRLLRVCPADVTDGTALTWAEQALTPKDAA